VVVISLVVMWYVGANLLWINLAPILHHFAFTVEVTDRETSTPIPGAAVSWKQTNLRSGYQWLVPIGNTGSDGRLVFQETLQEQPRWLLPMLGHFRFTGRVLDVRADHYQQREVRVGEELRGIPYGTTGGEIRVALGHQ
jgi:hypothetical protein